MNFINQIIMKKVLLIFVALISMLAMTSCDDKEKCVGNWVSESFSEDGFRGNLYLDLMENGKATLTIKGAGNVEEEGVNMKIGMTAKVGGKWDASMGFLDLDFDPNKVKCSIDKIDTGDSDVNALIQLALSDPDTKKEMLEELKGELNVEDFNGSVEIEFDGDDVMKLTDDNDVIMKFRRM